MKVKSGITIFGGAIFVPVLFLGFLQIGSDHGVFRSLPIHLILSLVMVVSSVIFWHYAVRGFAVSGSFRTLVIALGLLYAGVGFLSHGLLSTFEVYEVNVGRSGWYEHLAGLVLAIVLLLAVGFSERFVKQGKRRSTIAAAAFLLTTAIVTSIIFVNTALQLGITVGSTVGQWTPLGRFMHVATIMFFTVAAIRYLYGAFLIRSEIALAFGTGIVLFAMAELTSGISVQEYDPAFWVAHLWYATGFLAFIWGGYASNDGHHEGDLSPSSGRAIPTK
ncbi:MAG: hypothetical protein Q7S89_02150 [bacterium]|nr:hypothetical protein [bacterium]